MKSKNEQTHKIAQFIDTKNRLAVCQKQGGREWGRCEIGEESQKVQISSYKINAVWDVMYRMLKIKNKMKSYDVNSSLA